MNNNLVCDNPYNKMLATALGVDDIKFNYDDPRREYFTGYRIKDGGMYGSYTKTEDKQGFPKAISCIFTKDGKRFGVRISTAKIVSPKETEFYKEDYVEHPHEAGTYYDIQLPYRFKILSHEFDSQKLYLHLSNLIGKLKSKSNEK